MSLSSFATAAGDFSNADLILASASPRRAELLQQIGVQYAVAAENIDESHCASESAYDYVQRLALEKAQAGYRRHNSGLPVLGADTICLFNGGIFGKPVDCDQAISMLRSLSANTHQVLSAVAIVNEFRAELAISKSLVTFRTISSDECLKYWHTGESKDKAGAYAIQGYGATFVAHLEGSYSGVMGLPLFETQQLLGKFNVPIWQS